MKIEIESVDEVLEDLDKKIKKEEQECLAIIDKAISHIRNTSTLKGVEEDVDSIEL